VLVVFTSMDITSPGKENAGVPSLGRITTSPEAAEISGEMLGSRIKISNNGLSLRGFISTKCGKPGLKRLLASGLGGLTPVTGQEFPQWGPLPRIDPVLLRYDPDISPSEIGHECHTEALYSFGHLICQVQGALRLPLDLNQQDVALPHADQIDGAQAPA
jgi:hypothetical protein